MSRVTPASPARFAAAAVTAVLLLFALVEVTYVTAPLRAGMRNGLGLDVTLYLGFARSWLDGDGLYLPAQLTGQPYVIEDVFGNAYAPTLLYLLVPFALGVPIALWWLIPIGIIGVSIARSRPAWWAWPILALVLVYPRTWIVVLLGNPSMWALAAITAGAVWGWPAVGAALKTTFAPLVLIGIRRRSWWVAAAVTLVMALPFGPLWLDYATALLNARSTRGIEYILGEWPIAIALIVVALSRQGQMTYRRMR